MALPNALVYHWNCSALTLQPPPSMLQCNYPVGVMKTIRKSVGSRRLTRSVTKPQVCLPAANIRTITPSLGCLCLPTPHYGNLLSLITPISLAMDVPHITHINHNDIINQFCLDTLATTFSRSVTLSGYKSAQ